MPPVRGFPRLTACPVVSRFVQARESLVEQTRDAWSAFGIGTVKAHNFRTGAIGTIPDKPQDLAARILEHSVLRAQAVWDAVNAACFVDRGDDFAGQGPIRKFDCESDAARFLVLLDLSGLLLKHTKEQSAYISALALGQTETNISALRELVDQINDRISGSGLEAKIGSLLPDRRVRTVCRSLMKVGQKLSSKGFTSTFGLHVLQAAQNILFIKRGCPAAEPWDVAKSIQQHREKLTEVHPRRPEDDDRRSRIKAALSVLVREVFGNSHLDSRKLPMPSLHACFDRAGTAGGAFGELATEFIMRRLTRPFDNSDDDEWGGLDSAQTTHNPAFHAPVLQTMREVHGKVIEVHSNPVLERVHGQFRRVLNEMDVSTSYDQEGVPTRAGVKPCAVVEPCKIRMITMGPAARYQTALLLQKFLWGTLSRNHIFQWVGKPITEEDWESAYPAMDVYERSQRGWVLVSGDYSAATDNLDPEFSDFAWDCICRVATVDGCPLDQTHLYTVGRTCLTGHELHYTEWDEMHSSKTQYSLPQKWGQLMGSPVSFPILNLINAAATAVGCGWTSGSVTKVLKEHCVHTNGDDVSFLLPKERYDEWGCCTRAVGLEKSLGKNYTSTTFGIINSEMRALRRLPGTTEVSWTFVGFLNLALAFGIDAKGSNAGGSIVDRTCFFELGPLARGLCRGCDEVITARRMKIFCERLAPVLRRCPPGVDYSAPEALGGLGLPLVRPVPLEARARCAWLACQDTASRLKHVTPPSRRPHGPIERALRRGMSGALQFTRVSSSRTFQSEDNLPLRLRGDTKVSYGGQGAVLSRALQILTNVYATSEDQDRVEGMTVPLDVDIQTWRDVDDEASRDLFDAKERARRELEYTHRVYAQCRRVKAAVDLDWDPDCETETAEGPGRVNTRRLAPMSTRALREWSDHRVLETVTFDTEVSRADDRIDYRASWFPKPVLVGATRST